MRAAETRPRHNGKVCPQTMAFRPLMRYHHPMNRKHENLTPEQVAEAKARRLTAMHLQDMEDNPLDAEQIEMFEMFEREGWSHERRLAYIRERAGQIAFVPAEG